MSRRHGKQDARNAVLDLDHYDVEDMIADLGVHRHHNLPLAGEINHQAAPAPDAKKFGKNAVKLAAKNEGIAAAWADLYEPDMDEDRHDGLGGGQIHRVGINFRPNQNILAGRGRGVPGRRTRSLSPARGRGRGRGSPAPLGIRMGTRPTKSFSKFVSNQSTAGDPSMRHIRPRVSTHAFDDMASSFGASPASIVPKPVRGPTDVSKDDSDVGHWYAGRLCINRDNEKFFSGPIENNAPGAAVQTKPQSSLLQPPTGPKLGQAGIRMVQADLNSIHRKDGPNANVAPAKLERTPPHLKPPSPAPSRIPVASKAENVPPDNSGNFEGLAGLSSSKWASEAVPGGPKASRLPSKRSKNLLNTPPTDGDEWVKPPPPSTPEEVIAPNDRWKAQITPVSNRGSPHGSSSCRSRTGQLKIEDGPPPQMPFPTHVEIGRDPKTLEDFEARIASMEDEIGGAGVVLSVYLEELEIITNEEISTMKKAEAIKNNKKIKADRVAKQKTLVDIKTATINSLKERRAKLIKEQERAHLAKEEAEHLEREKIAQNLERLRREQKNAEKALFQEEYIKRQQAQTNAFAAKLLSQSQQKEIERLEKERLEEERAEMERTAKEQERIEKELAEKERLENERLVKEKEQLEKERAEKERLENERIRENERLEKERAEKEKSDKEIADKLKADQERAENLKADRERAEKMMADREAKLNAEQEKNSKPKVVFKPPPVFASGGQDAARDSATFREFNIIDPNNFTAYPKKVKVVFRPIFDKDPLDVVFLHTDQPGQKFRRALNQYLGPKDTKYLMGLESVIAFIDNATNRFYDNVGSIVF